MKLHYLVFLLIFEAHADNVQVEGVISIMLNDPSNPTYQTRVKEQESVPKVAGIKSRPVSDENLRSEKVMVTAGPMVECMYVIPEKTQAQALLSNMMNELTKMFVRAHEIINDDFRRRGQTRFRVVSEKNTDFFEDIYGNMTKQYLAFYDTSAIRVDRSGRQKDPCENQKELKELWIGLLDSSLTTFRQAASKCIDEHLKTSGDHGNPKIRQKMSKYLLKELRNIKMSQLEVLCDKFQLCYHELVRRRNKPSIFS